ncbi:MAG: biopolymer transporter ExbD [Ignavibacteriae bacterium]|nr:MAG: biopolymer transporter ExbD [Ignavibacteriota bacterium]
MANLDTSEQPRRTSKKRWQNRKRLGFKVDMTPYVDVIMLLMTFFIMTSTLNQPQVMQINLPKDTATVKIPMDNVVYIRVTDNGLIGVSSGKEESEAPPVKVGFNELKNYIEALGQEKNDMVMILKFDKKGKYSYMVDVIDEINRADVEKRYSFSKMDEKDMKIIESIKN